MFGPGIKEKYAPGWPANPNARFLEQDLAGREIQSLENEDFMLEIGGLHALDYFGDGSFYLLNAPGVSSACKILLRSHTDLPSAFARASQRPGPHFLESRHLHLHGG
jgi:hypothetical protein